MMFFPVNIPPASWAARHTIVCLDMYLYQSIQVVKMVQLFKNARVKYCKIKGGSQEMVAMMIDVSIIAAAAFDFKN